jgi:PPOX class probable F420-dependent enzyme
MSPDDLGRVVSLLRAAAPAVLATRRKDGSTKVTPVWFRFEAGHFEVVIADGDVKLRHIERDPRVTLVIFETAAPFRGVRVEAEAEITRDTLDEVRRSITSRYLSDEESKAFTEARRGNGAVVRIPASGAKVWGVGG